VRRPSRRTLLVAAGVTLVLTAASVTAVAAAQDNAQRGPAAAGTMRGQVPASCQALNPPTASRVTVMLADMAGADKGGMMAGRGGSMMVHATPPAVPAGTVTLVAYNQGSRPHELIVLPLTPAASVGTRTVDADNTVDESASFGEASNSCRSEPGDGISPGAAGWVTLTLAPGRYELVCNLPGHYAAGMYTELDVT
jgi:uncharacterized cupredoxin-like copper-binding protein